MSFPTFRPALRTVNSSGAVTAGPLALSQPNAQGIYLGSAACEYVPELLGPWPNLAYQTRWKLLGYRVRVTLDFPLAVTDGLSGFANLYSYYVAGLTGESFAALEFNLFYGDSATWRGMVTQSPWSPRPAQGKQRAGYELSIQLEARDLIAAPGNWTNKEW